MKKINNELMSNIASYMDDEIRENLHAEMAVLNPTEADNIAFLSAYVERDKEFTELLQNEFNITL